MSQLVTGRTGDWEVVIGLEVHAQVSSKAKLFSGASASFGAAPNAHVSLVDAAMPGMLPVINRECVYQAIRPDSGQICSARQIIPRSSNWQQACDPARRLPTHNRPRFRVPR